MEELFREIVVRHALFPRGARVLVGLSGGGDSVALLMLLLRCRDALGIEVGAAHLDHGMRAEGAEDAAFVARFCAARGVSLWSGFEDVPGRAKGEGGGLEEAARLARREFLEKVARRHGFSHIALGHHRDDQAETFLHRLLRGAGASGLSAMAVKRGVYVRPLLFFSRSQVHAYLAREGLDFVEDASNSSLEFTRNRIRHQVLPLLKTFNPRIEEHLGRLCDRMADEEGYWGSVVSQEVGRLAHRFEGGVWLGCDECLKLHPALRRRLLRQVLEEVRGDLRGVSSSHLEAVESLLVGSKSQAEAALPRAWVARRYRRLLFCASKPELRPPFALSIPGPGRYTLPAGEELIVSLVDRAMGEGPCVVEFDSRRVSFPLTVRTFRAGDRFSPSGMEGTLKLKDFFINEKIDREARSCLPLVAGLEVLWVAGLRRCNGFRPGPGRCPVLRMEIRGWRMATIGL